MQDIGGRERNRRNEKSVKGHTHMMRIIMYKYLQAKNKVDAKMKKNVVMLPTVYEQSE